MSIRVSIAACRDPQRAPTIPDGVRHAGWTVRPVDRSGRWLDRAEGLVDAASLLVTDDKGGGEQWATE